MAADQLPASSKSAAIVSSSSFKPFNDSIWGNKDDVLHTIKENKVDLNEHTIISRDTTPNSGAKEFSYIRTNQLEQYINDIEEKNRCFYNVEVNSIDFCQGRKLKGDFDLEEYNKQNVFNPLFPKAQEVGREGIISTLLNNVMDTFKRLWPEVVIQMNDILFYDSTTPKKFSVHFVIRKYYVSDNFQAKHFIMELKKIDWTLNECIDENPYSTFQNFRLPECHKIGKTNIKKPVSIAGITPSFLDGITTYIKSCMKLPDLVIGSKGKKHNVNIEIDDESIEQIFNKFNSIEMFKDKWKYRDYKDGNINLKQQKPCFCPLCNRTHDGNSDNNSLYLRNNIYGDTELRCRRFEGGKFLFNIGTGEVGKKNRLIELKPKGKPTIQFIDDDDDINPFPEGQSRANNFENTKEELNERQSLWLEHNINNNIKKLTEIYPMKRFIRKEFKSNEIFPIPEDVKTLCIKAPCGTGKTKAIIEFIANNKDKTIAIFSPRIAFAKSLKGRIKREIGIDFDLYQNLKGKIKSERIICQIESLHRLGGCYDIVIIDEIESCLYQLTARTNGKNLAYNNKIFEELVTGANKFICMDALLSDRTMNYLFDMDMRGELHVYERSIPYVRQAIQFPFFKKTKKNQRNGEENFLQFLIDQLGMNKKIFLVCASKAKQDAFCTKIKEAHPYCNIKYYNKENKLGEEDVNNEWIKYDVVTITSTITVGVNFSMLYFDFIALYMSTMSEITARDMFQMKYRVRQTKENKLYWIHNNNMMPDKEVTANKQEILMRLNKQEQICEDAIVRILGEGAKNNMMKLERQMKDLIVWNKFEEAVNLLNKEDIFKYYLKEDNYTLVNIDEMPDTEVNMESDIVLDKYEPKPMPEYDSVPAIDPDEKQAIILKRRAGTVNEDELNQVMKYDFQNVLMEQIKFDHPYVRELWEIYWNNKPIFYNISYEKGLTNVKDREAIANMELSQYAPYSRMVTSRFDEMERIKKDLGLKCSRDFFTEISKETLEKLADDFIEKQEQLSILFNVRASRGKGKKSKVNDTVKTINGVLKNWSGTKLKATNSRRETYTLVDDKKIIDDEKLGLKLYGSIKPYEAPKEKHVRMLKIQSDSRKICINLED